MEISESSHPYEYRVHSKLGGDRRRDRVTPVLTPDGRLKLLPVHEYNAGSVCGGDQMLEAAEVMELDQARQPIRWGIRVRGMYARNGYILYRDFLAQQPDGALYEEILNEVLDRLAFDVDGRPTAELHLTESEHDAILHPKARERRVAFRNGVRMASKSRLSELMAQAGAVSSDPVDMDEETKAKAKKAAAESARKAGLIK